MRERRLDTVRQKLTARRAANTGAAWTTWRRRRSSATCSSASFRSRRSAGATTRIPSKGRRNFLKMMGASLALAGLTACTRQPTEHIMPYVRQPEELIPGRPLFYATAMTLNGVAQGVLAESHEGRPTKIEGNPEHPATLGACDVFSQASVLSALRSRPLAGAHASTARSGPGAISSAQLRPMLAAQQRGNGGAGIRILTETVTSPTMAAQFAAIQKLYPQAKWHQWEPAGAHIGARRRAAGVRRAGQYVLRSSQTRKSIVSLDSDFLGSGPGEPALCAAVRGAAARARRQHRHEPAVRRRADADADRHEGGPSPAAARGRRRRVRLGAGDRRWAWPTVRSRARTATSTSGSAPIARDLQLHKGASLVIAGDHQPPIVHALAHVMNASLGNVGQDGVLYGADRSQPGRSARLAAGSGEGSGCGRRRTAADCRRQSGLQRAGRTGDARPHPEGASSGCTSASRRRNLAKSASGICPKRTSSKRGAMRARSTARSLSSSR